MNLKNIYWGYTDTLRAVVDRLLSGRTEWTLHIRKDASGDYTFSLPWLGVYRECLTGGTEQVIDLHAAQLLGREPVAGDRFTIKVSALPLADASTKLTWQQPDDQWPESNWYRDEAASEVQGQPMLAWLCPLLQPMFSGEVPQYLWVAVKRPAWKRDRLKDLVLPFENPAHPKYAPKPQPTEEVDEDYEGLEALLGEDFAKRVYDV